MPLPEQLSECILTNMSMINGVIAASLITRSSYLISDGVMWCRARACVWPRDGRYNDWWWKSRLGKCYYQVSRVGWLAELCAT